MNKFLSFLFLSLLLFLNVQAQTTRVLIFTKTQGYRHASIETGRAALARMCLDHQVAVDSTENPASFNAGNLKKYKAVIFLNTTGDLFNSAQREALENYIHSGGGWMGIHAATDAEYNWPWYGKLAGAYFKSHPAQQEAVIKVVDQSNPATQMLPAEWKRFDEWYNYKEVSQDLKVLAYLDESSYKGGEMAGSHPIVWYHDFEGGRAFYTGFGHTDETFKEPLILDHLWGGIEYVMGNKTGK